MPACRICTYKGVRPSARYGPCHLSLLVVVSAGPEPATPVSTRAVEGSTEGEATPAPPTPWPAVAPPSTPPFVVG